MRQPRESGEAKAPRRPKQRSQTIIWIRWNKNSSSTAGTNLTRTGVAEIASHKIDILATVCELTGGYISDVSSRVLRKQCIIVSWSS
nr:hypothetical protein CFP56_62149 [Quercus suber]